MAEEDQVDYSFEHLEEGIFWHSTSGCVSEGVAAIQQLWTEGFSTAKPFSADGDGFSPSDLLLSSPRLFQLPEDSFLLKWWVIRRLEGVNLLGYRREVGLDTR